jgi:hypothetical protein
VTPPLQIAAVVSQTSPLTMSVIATDAISPTL